MMPCPECDGEGTVGTCHVSVCGTCGGRCEITLAEWQKWFALLRDAIDGESLEDPPA